MIKNSENNYFNVFSRKKHSASQCQTSIHYLVPEKVREINFHFILYFFLILCYFVAILEFYIYIYIYIFCFDEFQRSEGGLFVDMTTFLAFGKDYVDWNYEKTGNPVYLHIKQTRKVVPEDRPSKKPTLLAIGNQIFM